MRICWIAWRFLLTAFDQFSRGEILKAVMIRTTRHMKSHLARAGELLLSPLELGDDAFFFAMAVFRHRLTLIRTDVTLILRDIGDRSLVELGELLSRGCGLNVDPQAVQQ